MAQNYGLPSLGCGLLWGVVACYFGLLGFPGNLFTRAKKGTWTKQGRKDAKPDRTASSAVAKRWSPPWSKAQGLATWMRKEWMFCLAQPSKVMLLFEICIFRYRYKYICIYIYRYRYTYVCICIYIYIYVCIHIQIYVYVYMCVFTYILYIYIYTRTYEKSQNEKFSSSAPLGPWLLGCGLRQI